MTYTGQVTPGGPPDVRELADLTISKQSVGPMDNNAYLLRCRRTGEQLLVDAANDADRLLALVGDTGLATVVTTHQHQDHWMALADVLEATGAASVPHAADAGPLPTVTRTVEDGETVRVGACDLELIHLVGAHPRLGRAALPRPGRPTRTCSPVTRCSQAGSATPSAARRTSRP